MASDTQDTDSIFARAFQLAADSDKLPDDLPERFLDLTERHEEELESYVEQLYPLLRPQDIKLIGCLLMDLGEVDMGQLPRDATTLPGTLRRRLRKAMEQGGDPAGPATVVLGADLLLRAHNQLREPPA